ncbi:PH domain-containing protein [Mucilaginibacter corticis]|uniref:PH domain-containing protein n=1 Tax=Mucilaginibacter corticis TaxID=2597670 RepID=A0A556MLY0_9SPHI|nr:PH domain-containing protein [Mucilaginibacter corticis]TSJ40926.1 PH domain-containing protein [Mucilaginibacter corticis]
MNATDQDIRIKQTRLFSFFKTLPLMLCTILVTWLANTCWPSLLWLSFAFSSLAIYRYVYLHRVLYLVTPQYIRITRGIFFKEIETVELFRVKDYVIFQPPLLQLCKLMNVQLKTTDPENPFLLLRGIPRSDIIDIIRERVLETRRHNQVFEIN